VRHVNRRLLLQCSRDACHPALATRDAAALGRSLEEENLPTRFAGIHHDMRGE
jgi:hypothetical protein